MSGFVYTARLGFRQGSMFYAFGFYQDGSDFPKLDNVSEYVAVTNTWSNRNDYPTPVDRSYPAAATIGTKGYWVGGGWDGAYLAFTDEYTPPNTWVVKTDLPSPERNGLCLVAIDSKLYAIGGWDGTSELQDTDEFTPGGNSWANKTDMPTPARQKFAAAVVSGFAYCMGGETNGGSRFSDNDAYDRAGNTWATISPSDLTGPSRSENAAAALGGLVYTFGGENNLKRVDAYDPGTDTYASKMDISTGNRWSHSMAVISGKAYLVAGKKNGNITRETLEYDPGTNVWAVKSDMPTPQRMGGAATSI
jgi:N-acetylneuraminic acid mutarotase